MKLNLTFRSKIFVIYSFFITLIIIGLVVSFYIYINSTLTKNAFGSMDQSVKRVTSQLDTLFEKMDNVSNLILLNKELQYILLDSLDYDKPGVNYFDANPDQKTKATSILLSIIGVKNPPRRTCLFNNDQNYLSFSTQGENYNVSHLNNIDTSSLEAKFNKSKSSYLILPPHNDDWTTEANPPVVISFVRRLLFTWGSSNPLGYIEIQQPYSMIEKICTSTDKNSRIIIKSADGTLIYPYNSSFPDYSDYYIDQHKVPGTQNSFIAKNPESGSEELVYRASSPITGWTILQILPKNDFMAQIYKIQQIIIISGTLLILITLIIIYLVTNSLTTPIKQLRQSLKNVSLQTPSLDIDFQVSNNEILLLNSAFNKTIHKLHEAMNQTIQARSKEVEAHFMALQAQIDPHFLYNSLMGISSAGQEYNNKKVVDMCLLLSNMLRYSASYNTSIVSLSDEINHAENYIRMLKYRYEDILQYEFILDDNSDQINVPKLILQPLLENCFSHGFTNSIPPYEIRVCSTISDNTWTISVVDNGSGFSESILENINRQIREFDEDLCTNNYENKMEFGGMAIINIYIRLRILYKDHLIFSISNNDSNGATVTIGGNIA